MAVATWWQGDALPQITPLPDFHADLSDNIPLIARLAQLNEREVQGRIETGHRLYIASLKEIPVGYGWLATQAASIGELGISFQLSTDDRYLWDFATLPAWRGRGIYPRLLQAILVQETQDENRFWIIHAPENHASEIGIHKAGMNTVAELSFATKGGVVLTPVTEMTRVQTLASLIHVPLLPTQEKNILIPCWKCGIGGKEDFCWSSEHHSSCTCVS